jgi:hypothetical protein
LPPHPRSPFALRSEARDQGCFFFFPCGPPTCDRCSSPAAVAAATAAVSHCSRPTKHSTKWESRRHGVIMLDSQRSGGCCCAASQPLSSSAVWQRPRRAATSADEASDAAWKRSHLHRHSSLFCGLGRGRRTPQVKGAVAASAVEMTSGHLRRRLRHLRSCRQSTRCWPLHLPSTCLASTCTRRRRSTTRTCSRVTGCAAGGTTTRPRRCHCSLCWPSTLRALPTRRAPPSSSCLCCRKSATARSGAQRRTIHVEWRRRRRRWPPHPISHAQAATTIWS